MAEADDWGGVPVETSNTDDWGGVPVNAPKLPDTSHVQETAKTNLAAANDNPNASPQNPIQKLDKAMGMPVSVAFKNGYNDTPLPPAVRKNLTNSYAVGTSNDAGDFMQNALHSVMPIIAGGVERAAHPVDFANQILESGKEMTKGGAELLAYPFLSDENKEEILKNKQFTDYKDVENPTTAERINRGIELERATIGSAMGGLYAPIAAPLAALLSPAIESTPEIVKKFGGSDEYAKLAPGLIGVGMDVLGGLGVIHGAGELRNARTVGTQFKPGTGSWDNVEGGDAIKVIIGQSMGKPPEQVTSVDIDQTIANGFKPTAPTAQDFHDVSTVMGGDNVSTLHIIYKETGKRPDQVFEDAKRDPVIAEDVSDGKIPEAYNNLIEPKSKLLFEQLQVAKSDTGKSFNVVDKDGDHVQSGFDSAEEARQYIEDKKTGDIGNEPSEWSQSKQDVLTPESAKAVAEPKVAENIYSGIEEKVDRMDADMRALRLDSLNRKMEAGIATPKEVAERESISSKKPNIIPPSEIGRPTSLRTFLSNNGAKFNEASELISIKHNGEKLEGESALERANEITKESGYLLKDEVGVPSKSYTELQNLLTEKNGGREVWREQDTERVVRAAEVEQTRKNLDPVRIEHEAHNAGIDTEIIKGETEKQRTNRLLKGLQEFYKNTEGSILSDAYRKVISDTIIAMEKFAGKLTGNLFEKLATGYIKTFTPEIMGDAAKRADAYMAKFKVAKQEAENAFYSQSAKAKKAFDKLTDSQRMEWLYDHETGRWNERDDPDHARYQALLDATFKAEKEAIGADADKGYKENYLPHVWENPEAVKAFFNSDAMVKKYGKDGFTKASTFKLIQDGVRAGFKLKTNNPESMLTARLLAGHDMIATMNLLRDFENSGIAKPTKIFSVDKRITKTEAAITELQDKYKAASDKINDPRQLRWDFADPAVSNYMKSIEARLEALKTRLEDFNKEKSENKLTPDQMKELKSNGFKIIGPDSKVWNIHNEVAPIWKNAMESKGLWERDGVTGDFYRTYAAGKAMWVSAKLAASLFHPIHVAMIHLASGGAAVAEHLIHGGKFSDLALKDTSLSMGLTKEMFKLQEHPAVAAWKIAPEARTPEQQKMVATMIEGGFKPTMSARDTIHFRENFDKAINGVGLNNLRLIGTVLQLPGKIMSPFMEHWIPGLKSEMYLRRAEDAIRRDPSLTNDAGKRGEVLRQIAKDTERTYGEMNQDVLFWNKTVRDGFNAAYISGGWKLAQIYNARGLLQPLNIAYKFAKTGEFSKEDITYNMLNAYAYTGLTLATGAAVNAMLGNPIGTAKDTVWDIVKNLVAPKTGELNPDGTPIRLQQPAFAKEAYILARDINTKGLISGSGDFLYHTTLIPSIFDTLNNRDFIGREIISDPTDLYQWMNAGWDTIGPIALSGYEKADAKNSGVAKVAGVMGFPMAGAYMNQTPFEQKVLYTYSEQNPPKGDVYSAKLKGELRAAIANGDEDSAEEIKQKMEAEGITESQISSAEKVFDRPFVDVAWKKLSAKDQKRLIESASPEERGRFTIKED